MHSVCILEHLPQCRTLSARHLSESSNWTLEVLLRVDFVQARRMFVFVNDDCEIKEDNRSGS